jgi:hypothetical protein
MMVLTHHGKEIRSSANEMSFRAMLESFPINMLDHSFIEILSGLYELPWDQEGFQACARVIAPGLCGSP